MTDPQSVPPDAPAAPPPAAQPEVAAPATAAAEPPLTTAPATIVVDHVTKHFGDLVEYVNSERGKI